MDIIDRIEELESFYGDLKFTDRLDLTEHQRYFVDLEDDSREVMYELLSPRCSGRTYSMLLKAIKIALNEPGTYYINVLSRTYNGSRLCANQMRCILEDNSLLEYVNCIAIDHVDFKNGVRIRFGAYNQENTLRGHRCKYIFVDDWSRYFRDSDSLAMTISSATLPYNDGQVFYMCTN